MIMPQATTRSINHAREKDPKQAVNIMIQSLPEVLKAVGYKSNIGNDVKLGKTKLFMKSGFGLALDRAVEFVIAKYATMIQSRWRGKRARERLIQMVKMIRELGAWQKE